MKAIILAGGFGTRLRPLSCTRPKTFFPLVNKPLLQWIFEKLAKNNISDVILAVNGITAFYLEKQKIPKNDLKIRYSIDPPNMPLGTGGPIKNAEKMIGNSEAFLVLNGDIFADLNYREILKAHREKKAIATIALTESEETRRYGVAKLSSNNRVERFIEKPANGKAPTNLINAGIYVLDPQIFRYIPARKQSSMEREIFPKLVEEEKLWGYVFNGLWMDIGKPEEFLQANKILLNLIYKSKKSNRKSKIKIENPVAFDKGVKLGEESAIGPNVVIGREVVVGKSVHLKESVILPYVKIDDSASINGSIIGEGAIIGKRVRICKGCVVGDKAEIKDNIILDAETAVCPGKKVSENILNLKTIC
jgi:mannose-1-phosphate guanylyltransferase